MNKFIVFSLSALFGFGSITAEGLADVINPYEAQAESWTTFQMKEPVPVEGVMFLSFDMPSSAIPVIIPQGKVPFGYHTGGNPSYLFALSEQYDPEDEESGTFAAQVAEFIREIKMLAHDVEIISSVDTVTSQGFQAHDVTFVLPKASYPYRKCRLISLSGGNVYSLCTFSDDGQDQHERFIDSFHAEAISE